MMPLTTSDMKGDGVYAGEIMHGMTPKSQFRQQDERIHRSEATLPDGV